MKILMINQPLNNRGDESAHKALVRALLREEPEVSITVAFLRYDETQINEIKVTDARIKYIRIDTPWDSKTWHDSYVSLVIDDKYYYTNKDKLPPSLKLFMQLIEEADIILNAPGGICMGGFKDQCHVDQLTMAMNLHKRIAYFGRFFGPFNETTDEDKRFKATSIKLLHYFDFISIRDQQTENLAKALRIGFVTTTDSAFLERPSVNIPDELTKRLETEYSVFVPNSLIWHYAYTNKIDKQTVIDFYRQIAHLSLSLHPTYKIVMLPQTMLSDKESDNDVNFFNHIAAAINDTRVIVLPDTYNSDIQQTIIAKAKYLIGARYHSIVFAINNNVPFIALNYEHKILGLLEKLGKTDCMVDLSSNILTTAGRESLINSINVLLPTIKEDSNACELAHRIATYGFNSFTEQMLKQVPPQSINTIMNRITPPLVTVAIPAYKTTYLYDTIQSVIAQTYKNLEIIIVNDKSPNDIDSIVRQFDDKRISYHVNEQNLGKENPAHNWNKCLSLAHGEFFCLLCDDDLYMPEFVDTMLDLAAIHKECNVFRARGSFIDRDNNVIEDYPAPPEWENMEDYMWHTFKGYRTQTISEFFYRTNHIKTCGEYALLPLAWYADYLSVFNFSAQGGIASTFKRLVRFRQSGENISSQDSKNITTKIIATNAYVDQVTQIINGLSIPQNRKDYLVGLLYNRTGINTQWSIRHATKKELFRIWRKRKRLRVPSEWIKYAFWHHLN